MDRQPGSPLQNACSESFNSSLRDELLDLEVFATLAEAKVLGNAIPHPNQAASHRQTLIKTGSTFGRRSNTSIWFCVMPRTKQRETLLGFETKEATDKKSK